MWAESCEALDRAEQLRRQFFRPGRIAAWEPPVDVFETEHDLWILVVLPGVSSERIKIAVSDGTVIVSGERHLAFEPRSVIHRLEIPHGRFERHIALPSGQYQLDRQELANGCLMLGLRKLG
jgi:HSP20 family molecular chaperone IbpA